MRSASPPDDRVPSRSPRARPRTPGRAPGALLVAVVLVGVLAGACTGGDAAAARAAAGVLTLRDLPVGGGWRRAEAHRAPGAGADRDGDGAAGDREVGGAPLAACVGDVPAPEARAAARFGRPDDVSVLSVVNVLGDPAAAEGVVELVRGGRLGTCLASRLATLAGAPATAATTVPSEVPPVGEEAAAAVVHLETGAPGQAVYVAAVRYDRAVGLLVVAAHDAEVARSTAEPLVRKAAERLAHAG